jgi:hypothetical protein
VIYSILSLRHKTFGKTHLLHFWTLWFLNRGNETMRWGLLKSLFFSVGLAFELGASCLQSRHPTAWATPVVHFALVILEMESFKLFAQTGLEPQYSESQPPK